MMHIQNSLSEGLITRHLRQEKSRGQLPVSTAGNMLQTMSSTFGWVRLMKHRALTLTTLLMLLLLTLSPGAHAQEESEPDVEASEALVATPTTLPPNLSPVPKGLGLDFNAVDFPRPGEVEMLKAAGIRWMRTGFSWQDTEKADGYHFEHYVKVLKILEDNNIRPIFILAYGNSMYTGDDQNPPVTYDQRKKFADWVSAALKEFKGHHIIWELYNEPEIRGLNQVDYVKLAKKVGPMFLSAHEILVGPSLSHIPKKGKSNPYKLQEEFLRYCFDHHLLQYWSAVSVHPYRGSDGPETVTADYQYLRSIIRDRLILDHQPKRQVPIISSEWGYSSRPETASGSGNLIRDETEAKLLAREWLINLYNRIPISIWYTWHDTLDLPWDTPKQTSERHFGIVRFEDYDENRDPFYTPKPAYHAAQTLTRTLLGYHFDARINLHDEDDYALHFINGDQFQIAAWTTSAKHMVRIRVPPGDYEVINYVGLNPKQYYGVQNSLEIELTNAPVYIQKLRTN